MHVVKVQNFARQLADVEEVLQVAIMAKIFASLPPKYNSLKTAWDSIAPTSQQTIESLFAKETPYQERDSSRSMMKQQAP